MVLVFRWAQGIPFSVEITGQMGAGVWQLPTVSLSHPTWLSKIRSCESFPETVLLPRRHRDGGTFPPQPCLCCQKLVRHQSQTSVDKGVVAHLWCHFCGCELLLIKARAWESHSTTFTVDFGQIIIYPCYSFHICETKIRKPTSWVLCKVLIGSVKSLGQWMACCKWSLIIIVVVMVFIFYLSFSLSFSLPALSPWRQTELEYQIM